MDKTTQNSSPKNAPRPVWDLMATFLDWYMRYTKTLHRKPAWEVTTFYLVRALFVLCAVIGFLTIEAAIWGPLVPITMAIGGAWFVTYLWVKDSRSW